MSITPVDIAAPYESHSHAETGSRLTRDQWRQPLFHLLFRGELTDWLLIYYGGELMIIPSWSDVSYLSSIDVGM